MAARGEQGPASTTHVFVAPNPGRRLMRPDPPNYLPIAIHHNAGRTTSWI